MIYFKKIHKDTIFFFLILTVFIFPISNSLKSIFLPITALLILISPDFQRVSLNIFKEPWVKSILIVLFLVVLGLFLGLADWKHKLIYFNKYSKIVYIPLLAFAFQDKRSRTYAIHAFLFAMFFTMLICAIENFWLLKATDPLIDGPFQNHIDTGLLIAFSAYLTAINATKKTGHLRIIYWVGCLLFSMHTVFINASLTGYLALSVLFFVFLTQYISWRKLALYLPVAFFLCCFIGLQSPICKQRIELTFKDVKQFQIGEKNTSIGFRLQFAEYAHQLFFQKPLMGYGTAGFTHQFRLDNPIPSWGPDLGDPHNQYWSFAVDYGLVGLISLFYFFFTIYWSTRQSKEQNFMIFALLAVFLTANFCDSLLLLANGGYFFVIFSAIGLGESLALHSLSSKEASTMGVETC